MNKIKDPAISVIIPTFNRPKLLQRCLEAILASEEEDFEILIADQSINIQSRKVVFSLQDQKLHYYHYDFTNKSRALNSTIKRAKSEIIVLTDDDCRPREDWLKKIMGNFQDKPSLSILFGRVSPLRETYQPKKNCPCTFERDTSYFSDKDSFDWSNFAGGNNMSFRKKVFGKVGGFREWLGPGSVAHSHEDCDFAYRVLRADGKAFYSPEVVVYHDRWLSRWANSRQNARYFTGITAGYGSFFFKGDQKAFNIFRKSFLSHWRRNLRVYDTKPFNFHFKKLLRLLVFFPLEVYCFIKGLLIGFYFARLHNIS